MTLLPLYLLIFALPLGVAGQNISVALAALWMIIAASKRRSSRSWGMVAEELKIPLSASLLLIIAVTVGSAFNPQQAIDYEFFFGYMTWAFLPGLVCFAYSPLRPEAWKKLETGVAIIALAWGLIALSQALWGWRVQGAAFSFGPTRAQGLYSHPLTFAYASLLLFPYGCAKLIREPRHKQAWAIALGAGIAIFASQSRTVQVVGAALVLFNVFFLAKGRWRLTLLAAVFGGAVLISATDNPVSRKFGLWAQGGWDVHSSDYPDDRLAFWHAHWEMAKDRPLFGHGDKSTAAYRAPYYERIGLPDFPRQYEAHNMYLQVLVSGGIVALAAFLSWLAWLAWRIQRLGGFEAYAAMQTLLAFALAGVTQNAFQDSEVRYALTLLCAALVATTIKPAKDKPRWL